MVPDPPRDFAPSGMPDAAIGPNIYEPPQWVVEAIQKRRDSLPKEVIALTSGLVAYCYVAADIAIGLGLVGNSIAKGSRPDDLPVSAACLVYPFLFVKIGRNYRSLKSWPPRKASTICWLAAIATLVCIIESHGLAGLRTEDFWSFFSVRDVWLALNLHAAISLLSSTISAICNQEHRDLVALTSRIQFQWTTVRRTLKAFVFLMFLTPMLLVLLLSLTGIMTFRF